MSATLARFALVGAINTAIGFALIVLGLQLGLGDYTANALGYGLGMGVSYALNRKITFKVENAPSLREFGRFTAAFLLAYAANIAVLALGRAAGLAGQPMLHLAGLGLYSLLFFILSHKAVFGTGSSSSRQWHEQAKDHVPEIVLLAVAIGAALTMRDIALTHDVVWQLWIARQIVHGASLYRDILELNPPLWFWSAVPLDWAGRILNVSPGRLLVQAVIAGATLSALAVGALAEPERLARRAALMILVFVFEIIVPIYDFGQREQLALICALPYAALLARRHDGAKVPWQLALAIGVVAAYGFALKHYFAIIPLGLEAWLAIHARREGWQAVRPETVALASLALVYAGTVVLFASDFLDTIAPMVLAAYHGYESAWPVILLRPWTIIWGCLAIYIVLSWTALHVRDRTLPAALLITAAGFLLAYLVQRKGWLYHTVPVTGALSVAAGAIGLSLTKRNLALAIIGAVVLAFPLSLPVRTGPYHNPFRDTIDPVLATVAPGETLFIAATDPMWGWPMAEDHGLILRSRYYAYWMLPAIANARKTGTYPDVLKRLEAQIKRDAMNELRCGRPALIIFERRRTYALQPPSADVEKFFTENAELQSFITDHYARVPSAKALAVYKRTSPVPVVEGLQCPSFS